MANPKDLLSTTLEDIRDELLRDNLFVHTALLNAFDKSGSIAKAEQGGGTKISIPAVVSNHSVIQDLTEEDTVVSISVGNVSEDVEYNWSLAGAPIVLGLKAEILNQAPEAQLDILEMRMKRTMEQLRYELNRKIIANPTGVKFSEMDTFYGIADGSGVSTGFFSAKAYGSQTNTVGGILQTNFADSWQHQFSDAVDLFGTNGRPQLDLLIAKCQQASMDSGKYLLLTNQTVWSNLRRSLVATELYEGTADVKGFGYGRMIYNGVPVDFDQAMPAQVGSDADEELGAYCLNLDDIKLFYRKGAWFDIDPVSQGLFGGFAGKGTLMKVCVALAAAKLSSSGILVDANTYS